MKPLRPQQYPLLAADPAAVFASDSESLRRTVRFLASLSDLKPYRYDPCHPSADALISEITLVNAVYGHSAGKVSDEQIKSVLSRYTATHSADDRASVWAAGVPLFYLDIEGKGCTCNALQAYIVRAIAEHRAGRTLKCRLVRLNK